MNRRKFLTRGTAAGVLSMGRPAYTKDATGFFVPAEERRHLRTFMQWPVSRQVYRDPVFLAMVQQTIADVANTIADFEPVVMLADASHHAAARQLLSEAVELWDIPTEDLWCRDAGPIFLIDGHGGMAVSHIQFNGWGERQVNRHDRQIAERVAARLGLDLLPTGLKGEAGGVEQDGHGLLLAHESSWVHRNRNPGLSRGKLDEKLLRAYGAERIIWAPGLRDQDITDYHIDSLARLTGPGRVLMNLPDRPDPRDPFHKAALETHDILEAAGLEIEVIPEPERRRGTGDDFVASYANYYVCNGAVIAAQFGDRETDAIAREALMRHYPSREVVMLNVDPLGEIGGGIHCATHQMPVP